MSVCPHKHTKYQPTDEEWRCPKCGSDVTYFTIWDGVESEDCSLLHDEDELRCEKCGYEGTGKAYASYLVKKNNLVPCPICKGKGMVKKDAVPLTKVLVEALEAVDKWAKTATPVRLLQELEPVLQQCRAALRTARGEK